MKIYFNLVDGRLDGWSSTKRGNSFEAEVPDDHEVLSNPYIFKFENDEFIKDTEYQNQLIAEAEKESNVPNQEEINAVAILELAELISQMAITSMKGGE
ncbi:hypothetical protein MHI57_07055 [Cytobacillus sp. FSL K6-0129]|uniref:hypothetical protein n=1 Tax=Cytobacillus sp. FSL K6-0129 TaxID=2921421 RepID=UPI0030F96ADC